jgi:hypothetical protein
MNNTNIKIENSMQHDESIHELLRKADTTYFIMFAVAIGSFGYAISQSDYSYFSITVAALVFISFFKMFEQKSKNEEIEKTVSEVDLVDNAESKKYATMLGYFIRKHFEDGKIPTSLFQSLKKAVGLKYKYRTIGSESKNIKDTNVIAPVLLDDVTLRTHVAIAGTTGSGKTELIVNSFFASQCKRGGGCALFLGKSDNEMMQKVQAVAAKYNRLHELLIYDFAADAESQVHSNSLNLFELGNLDQTTTVLSNLAQLTEKGGDNWKINAKTLFDAYIAFILQLRDAEMICDPEKIEEVYFSDQKLKQYEKNIVSLNSTVFFAYLRNIEKMLMLLELVDYFYEKTHYEFHKKIYRKNIEATQKKTENNVVLGYSDVLSESNQFHTRLKNALMTQIKIAGGWKRLKEVFKGKVQNIMDQHAGNQSPFYTLEVSQNFYANLVAFFDKFPSISNSRANYVSLLDAMDQNRLIVFNLPGQNKTLSPLFADLVISILSSLSERRGKTHKSDTTMLAILDEVNSWLKNSKDEDKGVGDLMSVIRGLKIGCVMGFQSDLTKTMKETEASQVFANFNTHVVLKLEDEDLIEKYNKKITETKSYELEETAANAMSENSKNKNQSQQERGRFTAKDEKFFKDQRSLRSLKNGAGWIIRNGAAKRFHAFYENQKTMYKDETENIELNSFVARSQIQKQLKEKR